MAEKRKRRRTIPILLPQRRRGRSVSGRNCSLRSGLTLVWEIVKANVQTMKVILSPKAAYRPAVVRLQVPLEEASSRVLLSNSITLTPGTVTIRQQEEEFLVLCLDKDGGEAIPDWNLVRILKKLEGSK